MVRSGGQGVYLCSTFLVAPARNAPYEDGWARIHTANALGFNPFSGVPPPCFRDGGGRSGRGRSGETRQRGLTSSGRTCRARAV